MQFLMADELLACVGVYHGGRAPPLAAAEALVEIRLPQVDERLGGALAEERQAAGHLVPPPALRRGLAYVVVSAALLEDEVALAVDLIQGGEAQAGHH